MLMGKKDKEAYCSLQHCKVLRLPFDDHARKDCGQIGKDLPSMRTPGPSAWTSCRAEDQLWQVVLKSDEKVAAMHTDVCIA